MNDALFYSYAPFFLSQLLSLDLCLCAIFLRSYIFRFCWCSLFRFIASALYHMHSTLNVASSLFITWWLSFVHTFFFLCDIVLPMDRAGAINFLFIFVLQIVNLLHMFFFHSLSFGSWTLFTTSLMCCNNEITKLFYFNYGQLNRILTEHLCYFIHVRYKIS